MKKRQTANRTPHARRVIAVLGAFAVLVIGGSAWAQAGYWHAPPVHVCSQAIDIGPGSAPYEISAPVAGEIPCGEVTGFSCVGYVTPEPICLHVAYPTTISIDVTWANVDSVLALIGPGGTFADDDGGHGTNSRLVRYLSPGDYLLYTGSYSYRQYGSVSISLGDASWIPTPPPAVVIHPTPPPVYYPTPPIVHVPTPPRAYRPSPPRVVHPVPPRRAYRPDPPRAHRPAPPRAHRPGRHGHGHDRGERHERPRPADRGERPHPVERDDDRGDSRGRGEGRGHRRGNGRGHSRGASHR